VNAVGPSVELRIPKPRGSAGDGFRLIEAMQLENNPALSIYGHWQREVKLYALQAGLDWTNPFKEQSAHALGCVYSVVSSSYLADLSMIGRSPR